LAQQWSSLTKELKKLKAFLETDITVSTDPFVA
jgi:hypothetical protein